MEELLNSTKLLTILGAIGGGIFAFFMGLLMERYKNRRLILKWKITSQVIGIPSDAYLQDNLIVTYNGIQANSLYLFKLQITNDSNFDKEDLPINFFSDLDSIILSHSVSWTPDTSFISTSQTYEKRRQNLQELMQPIYKENPKANIPAEYVAESSWVHRNRMIKASSLNRKEKIEFSVLIGSSIKNHIPELYLEIPKSGINLVEKEDIEKYNQKISKISLLIGFIITIIVGFYFAYVNRSLMPEIILLTLIGAFNFLLGILIYRSYSFIHSYFK
jgi:hypothetical protein